MKEIEVDISAWKDEFGGKEPIVILKKLTFGDFVDLQDKIADIKIIGTQQIINPKLGKAKMLMLLKSIKTAPFKIDENSLKALPYDLGEFLFVKIDEMNEVNQKN